MAAGRPALFVGPSSCETADTIRDAGCGLVVDPARGSAPEQIAAALRAWRADPASARSAGERGREAFQSRFTAEANCAAFADVLR
jgi:colanic acid biosynthesis glycosyl transferase WcaI